MKMYKALFCHLFLLFFQLNFVCGHKNQMSREKENSAHVMTFHIYFFRNISSIESGFYHNSINIIFKTWSSFEMLISGILHQLYAKILHLIKILIIYPNYFYVVFPSDILGKKEKIKNLVLTSWKNM